MFSGVCAVLKRKRPAVSASGPRSLSQCDNALSPVSFLVVCPSSVIALKIGTGRDRPRAVTGSGSNAYALPAANGQKRTPALTGTPLPVLRFWSVSSGGLPERAELALYSIIDANIANNNNLVLSSRPTRKQ